MNCKLKYIGETSRKLHMCLKEQKRDKRIGNLNDALFLHISQSNHNFDFNSAISIFNSLNTRPGFYNILNIHRWLKIANIPTS